ncbi:thiamine-monophosphate kinase [Paraburkholderia bannensis]|uniref:Thiamine-monophosphate kinase n=1 Tax=Paraburkholderia bannensis TaxID=765414 RepID=A0A7W9WT10_9BURK|nr:MULTISPECIES: thiamine-phosphate kinase [Paraburkholderia]MBB3257793.1 thiamine-monophosphate kinase [Paraburkholderia sp. WP4_3_2]MBB6102806.1 thiamine-monophosphate kinase [Paraburkholderia bannensis]
MLSEFSLIDRYFAQRARTGARRATLGIGDDCALIAPAAGEMLAVSTDMLVEGRHFFPDVDPHALGHKALAVNLSDLAAMGAQPLGFTLAFALPKPDENWLAAFSAGMFELAERHDCELMGGDTTAGPLNLCLTVFGSVRQDVALRRDTAQTGDDIWVSGTPGDARAGLAAIRGEWPHAAIDSTDAAYFRRALEYPQPQVALGLALRGVARAALDISDGLAGDLRHILTRSHVNADIDVDALPLSDALARLPRELQLQCALAGGDDYELCFTAAPQQREAVAAAAQQAGVRVTRIGTITSRDTASQAAHEQPDAAPTMTWRDRAGTPLNLTLQGFDHFHAD